MTTHEPIARVAAMRAAAYRNPRWDRTGDRVEMSDIGNSLLMRHGTVHAHLYTEQTPVGHYKIFQIWMSE